MNCYKKEINVVANNSTTVTQEIAPQNGSVRKVPSIVSIYSLCTRFQNGMIPQGKFLHLLWSLKQLISCIIEKKMCSTK